MSIISNIRLYTFIRLSHVFCLSWYIRGDSPPNMNIGGVVDEVSSINSERGMSKLILERHLLPTASTKILVRGYFLMKVFVLSVTLSSCIGESVKCVDLILMESLADVIVRSSVMSDSDLEFDAFTLDIFVGLANTTVSPLIPFMINDEEGFLA